ncbi:MAG TPA: hypothetical protein VKT28_11205 [Puia sp.]|nr:hypothetical protein [Puia sp.]
MKRAFSICLFSVFSIFIFSCKKSSSDNKYYIKFTANDTSIAWLNGHIQVGVFQNLYDSTKTDFVFVSDNHNQDTSFSMQFSLTGKSIPAATYSSTNSSLSMYVDYNLDNNNMGNTPLAPDYYIDDVNGMPPSTFTINITSITSSEVRGTFTANYLTSYFTGPATTVTITKGEFYAPVVHQ